MIRWMILVALLSAGCLHAGQGFDGLPAADKEAWTRCERDILHDRCGANPMDRTITRNLCEEELTKRFLKQTTSEQRRAFLVEQGCPEATARPERPSR
jgi:hypothetical protein